MSEDRSSLKQILDLIQSRKLKEVKRLANKIEITDDAFYKLIMLAKMERLDKFPYIHQSYHREHQPEHLQLNDKDLKAIAGSGVGKIEGDAVKAFSKVNQMFVERKWVVGHIFYTPDFKYWHFFYFDLKDTCKDDNHWKFGGEHIHYISDLNPQHSAKSVWNQFIEGSKSFGGNVHIKFKK